MLRELVSVNSDHLGSLCPACPVAMDTFQVMQPENVGRILEKVKTIICVLDLALPGL